MYGTTRMFTVPFLTNTVELNEGEELLLQAPERIVKLQETKKRTWKDVHVAKAGAKAGTSKKQKGLDMEGDP